ncbi:MAG: hypothetical protein HYT11_00805 [Candidatus Levybacteria bacterium]|nr:hypothetical protein [Candidatus Levybacteria bacterium]
MDKDKPTKQEENKLHIEIVHQVITLSTSGFGVVAALAWNNVIREFVDSYIAKWIPQGGSLISLLVYAIIVTALAVLVTIQLSKLLRTLEGNK